jgi:dipeptidyl aminopeptidase/acylaminoacyl peptidase
VTKAIFVGALLVCSMALADEPRQLLSTQLAELYGASRASTSHSLSPDGSRVAAIRQPKDGSTQLVVRDFSAAGWSVVLARPPGAERLVSCTWKTATKLLCKTRKHNSETTQWLAVNADGTRETDLGIFQYIIHLLPDDPEHILVRRHVYGAPVADVLGVETGSVTPVPDRDRFGVLGDGSGAIRVRPYYDQQERVDGWAFLPEPRDAWVVVHHRPLHTDWFQPAAFDETTNEVLYLDLADGHLALFAWDGHGERRTVRAEPFAHVVGVSTIGKRQRAGSAYVLDGQTRYESIDPRVASVRDAAQRLHPSANVHVVEEDWNQRFYLVFVGDRQGAGRYYRFDSTDARLDEIGPTHENLQDRTAAPRTTLRFSTAEGQRAEAHVTVPPGATRPLPAVVVPSGSSDWPDKVVPYLVASGFVVVEHPVEPLRYEQEFGSNWHTTVAEISASLRELARAGTIDPDRVCALGMTLGAYVALMSATEDRNLFRCVVAINATIDPIVGNAMTASLNRGANLSAPVLLLGEDSDRTAVKLRNALERHGAPAELFRYRAKIYDSTIFETAPELIDLLARLGAFLSSHLGSGVDRSAADQRLP